MIKFTRIFWKNFLSTGNVGAEVFLDKYNNTLIVGENGAGKSTILDALTFALFGKPYRNINKPQLVNSINAKECLVELKFSIAENEYTIRRGIKPNVFEIFLNDELMNQDAKAKDYQDMLERMIIKMNYKSFTQIVILGAASFTPFMQLAAADRRAVIEDLLDIQIFTSMNIVVKDKLSELKGLISETKIRLDNVKEKIELHKAHLDEMKKNNADMVEKKKADITTHVDNLAALNDQKTQLEADIESLLQQVVNYDSLVEKEKKLNTFEARIDANKGKLEKEIRFYNTTDQCPTCKQNINTDFKAVTIEECNKTMEEYSDGLAKLKDQKDAIVVQIQAIKSTQRNINRLETDLATVNSSISHTRRYIRKLEEEVEELASPKKMSADSKEQSEKLVQELTDLLNQRKTANEEKQYYDVAAQLLKDGGIKTKIIKQYLPVINKMVNKYLASMDFFVNFNIDEEFKETIKSRHRDDFSYENFSEGEKQKIDLALLLTWRSIARLKNSVNTNLLILDETFDSSLDAKGTDSLMQILQTLPNNTNVFVISHKDQLFDKFTNAIRFEKKQNFSRIV
jgi:DNA repair exonuclease SbcCD ATPase subunit